VLRRQNDFDYLSGTISVNRAAPDEWRTRCTPVTRQHYTFDLPFWSDPNNDAWGIHLCRILYHESLHFWQIFSSAYVASLVADEWSRLLTYEATGTPPPPTQAVMDHSRVLPDNPFSARELVECWARYWDVHTRGPERIIREEQISVPDGASLRDEHGYTGEAYDLVMTSGEDCAVYGRPYRWLLQGWESRFAALFFPVIAHAALATCRPVTMFCFFGRTLSARLGRGCDAIQQEQLATLRQAVTGVVNVDWLWCYGRIIDALVRPWLDVLGGPIVDWLRGYGVDTAEIKNCAPPERWTFSRLRQSKAGIPIQIDALYL
jgi:hypothetical protein